MEVCGHFFFKPSYADICQAAQKMKLDPSCTDVTVSEETGSVGECLNSSMWRRQHFQDQEP